MRCCRKLTDFVRVSKDASGDAVALAIFPRHSRNRERSASERVLVTALAAVWERLALGLEERLAAVVQAESSVPEYFEAA